MPEINENLRILVNAISDDKIKDLALNIVQFTLENNPSKDSLREEIIRAVTVAIHEDKQK